MEEINKYFAEFDPKEHKKRHWILNPLVYYMFLWIITNISALIVYIYLMTRLGEKFYIEVVSADQLIFYSILLIVLLITFVLTLFTYVRVPNQRYKALLIISSIVSLIYIVIALIYYFIYGTKKANTSVYNKITDYMGKESANMNKTIYIEFLNRIGGKDATYEERTSNISKYVHLHVEQIGSFTIGFLIIWVVFQLIILHLIKQGIIKEIPVQRPTLVEDETEFLTGQLSNLESFTNF